MMPWILFLMKSDYKWFEHYQFSREIDNNDKLWEDLSFGIYYRSHMNVCPLLFIKFTIIDSRVLHDLQSYKMHFRNTIIKLKYTETRFMISFIIIIIIKLKYLVLDKELGYGLKQH